MACPDCNGKGKVPVIGKFSGQPVPNAFRYCHCHRDTFYPAPREVEADFPCSDSYRAAYQNESPVRLDHPQQAISIPQVEESLTVKRYDRLTGQVIFLQNRMNEHLDAERKRGAF